MRSLWNLLRNGLRWLLLGELACPLLLGVDRSFRFFCFGVSWLLLSLLCLGICGWAAALKRSQWRLFLITAFHQTAYLRSRYFVSVSHSKLSFDSFMFLILCIKRCMAFLLTHSTVASIEERLSTIEYIKSLRLKTSRRIQAKSTRCACIRAASIYLNLYYPKAKNLVSL